MSGRIVTLAAGLALAALVPAAAAAAPEAAPSDRGRLSLKTTFGGAISPKSVASSGTGLVFAQNMMYRHSVTVYDAKGLKRVATISDRVDLGKLGQPGHPGLVNGAPVEADFSPDGRYGYVSNYSMYGAGFGPEGSDTCTPSSGTDRSYVYRIALKTLTIDRAYLVGAVPKVVRATPDGKYVLVANWCSWDLSVLSRRTGRVVKSIPMGPYPRGIAVSPTKPVAYVAVMGSNHINRVDLTNWSTRSIGVGAGPRALVVHPDGTRLFATLNAEGRVARLDLRTGAVTKVSTGNAPRSMDISDDGRSLYVVNYESGTVSKLRSADMRVLQTVTACYHPIGITYEPVTRRVWVACYGGSIMVFDDR